MRSLPLISAHFCSFLLIFAHFSPNFARGLCRIAPSPFSRGFAAICQHPLGARWGRLVVRTLTGLSAVGFDGKWMFRYNEAVAHMSLWLMAASPLLVCANPAGQISLLFLFFFYRELCQLAVLPPGEEQRSTIVPSGWNIPNKRSES
jgi:hypothetical protein